MRRQLPTPKKAAFLAASASTCTVTKAAEAIRRAYHGVQRPVTIAGNRELVTEYSDTLLIFLLKGARPHKYRDNVHVEATLGMSALEQAIERGRHRAEAAHRDVAALPSPDTMSDTEANGVCSGDATALWLVGRD